MREMIIAAAVAVLAAAPTFSQESKVEADPEAAKIVADCSARMFESSIEIDKDEQKRLTKFKLCAAKDSDDAAWVKTLEDAKAKIAAHPDISTESKASIAAQLDVEIAKFETDGPVPSSTDTARSAAQPPAPVVATVASGAAPPPKPASPKPRLTLICKTPVEMREQNPCHTLERDSSLIVRADEDLAAGIAMRFLRRGDVRGEFALAPMRQGQSIRYKLPPKLCEGVQGSKVEIQILGSKQVAETLGPYPLRC
jgi:hypothetical protein